MEREALLRASRLDVGIAVPDTLRRKASFEVVLHPTLQRKRLEHERPRLGFALCVEAWAS